MQLTNSKYFPHPKQLRFHSATERYLLFLAGIGTGKTMAGIHHCLINGMRNPGYDGMIVSPTYPMLRDVILPLWKQYIPKDIYEYKVHDKQINVEYAGNRFTIYLRSTENPDTIRGLNLAWAWCDEIAMCASEEAWDIIQGRIGRIKSIPHPQIFATTTPKGYNWLIKKFFKAEDKSQYRVIRARSSDNPWMPKSFIEALRRDYGEDFARQELDAEIVESSGLCWDIRDVHTNWRERDIRDQGGLSRVVAGVDWGFSQPASIVVVGRTRNGTYYALEEWYAKGKLPRDIYKEMQRVRAKWNVKMFYCDSAEPARVAEAKQLGLPVKPVKKGEGSIALGVNEVRSLLDISSKTGKPGMYISNNCKWLLKEAEDYHFDNESEKIIAGSGDHACDALRYAVHSELNKPKIRGWK